MKNLIEILKQKIQARRTYYTLSFVFITIALIISGVQSKNDIVVFVNSHNNIFLDYFFKYITYLGDKYFVLMIIFIIILFNRKTGFCLLSVFTVPVIVTEFFKKIFHFNRPGLEINTDLLHFVEGVIIKQHNSFPSGHATIIFAMTTFLVLHTFNKGYQLMFLLIAICVCYSRLYLAQHFLGDVLAGALIGIIFGTITFIFAEKQVAKKRFQKFLK